MIYVVIALCTLAAMVAVLTYEVERLSNMLRNHWHHESHVHACSYRQETTGEPRYPTDPRDDA